MTVTLSCSRHLSEHERATPNTNAASLVDPVSAYTLPEEITLEVTAERSLSGGICIVGSTNLPDGTKLGAEVGKGQDFNIIVTDGRFKSEEFTDKGRPWKAGANKVRVFSIFNEVWQRPSILNVVGRGGKNLKGATIKKDDPTVIDSDNILQVDRTLIFPPVLPETVAVNLVKDAVLVVDGSRSSATVGSTVEMFMRAPGLRPGLGWRAELDTGKKYSVIFAYVDGSHGPAEAIWSADVATRKVAYVNKTAKYMSWTSPY